MRDWSQGVAIWFIGSKLKRGDTHAHRSVLEITGGPERRYNTVLHRSGPFTGRVGCGLGDIGLFLNVARHAWRRRRQRSHTPCWN